MLKWDMTINVPILITLGTVAVMLIVGWDRMSSMLIRHEEQLRIHSQKIELIERVIYKLEILLDDADNKRMPTR